ncbi:hypothetical protein B0T25DRAFT_559399 [Lasiosphaeria hispida]|uniref:Uncharacterized protein n=1 Tax=Lasiosphaeria hispida TaxID=260671 RepID=A0AAJ0H7J8_9PEZI|nr:hypothetical protein B0T25DRAFT_559399 [Lasiosphaeria hispida]
MVSPIGVAVSSGASSNLPASTPGSKRKVTPSAELSSSKRVLILMTPSKRPADTSPGATISTQPFFAPKRLFPHGDATIAQQYTYAHPQPPPPKEQDEDAIWHTKHVLLPFDLRDPGISIKGEVQDLLRSIFPGTHNVAEARFRSHLIFQVDQLPSSPWPLTVGGVPFTLLAENQGRALMFPRQIHGNPSISIYSQGYDVVLFSDANLRRLAADVHAHFEKKVPGLRVLELMHTCERTIYIVLEDHVNLDQVRAKVPGKIANCFVGYLHNQELCRPSWADMPAKRVVQPQPMTGVIDNTAYEVLRPGVLIRSKMLRDHAHPAVFSTTSGVLVENDVGDTFMTAASHGIGDGETVWQADRPDRTIGEAVVEISFTDVNLLKLKDDVTFVNQTFETDAGTSPEFTRLQTSEDELPWDLCHLNSPYTGNMEAFMVAKSVRFFKSSPYLAERNLEYIVYDWNHMGQEAGNEGKFRPPDGTCGSVIWDGCGVILGFYHFYIAEGNWAGFSVSASASAVVDAGYRLAK